VFRIQSAARLTGLSPEVIRAWERRYALLSPRRTDGGYRVYSPDDLDVLRGAKALIAEGQSIGEVARLPRERLLAEGRAAAPVPVLRTSSGASGPDEQIDRAITAALDAVAAFDRDAFEMALFPVLGLGALAPVEMCERVLLPLLRAIGQGWETGRLSIAAEHFGSYLVRTKILQLLELQPRGPSSRRIVCACPNDERHEGAMLAFAVHAAASGWRVIYLGASTPIEQALGAAERARADALALSLTIEPTPAELDVLADELARHHQARPGRALIVGGSVALRHRERFEAAGARVADTVEFALPR
jgi:DNA-binding transcriptional MerR regulator/methylmalonyl-CoA mutase cobalamin-binding subunit